MPRAALKKEAAVKSGRPKTVGQMIDEMYDLREERRKAEQVAKEAKEKLDAAEVALLERLKAEGIDKATGTKASASISTNLMTTVTDWDAFYEYVGKKKYFHLLERRPAQVACREIWERERKLPGAESFTKVSLNLRVVNE